jgi:hypothetical protein
MDESFSWFIERKVQRTIENLAKHNISGFYVENEIELINKLDELIPQNATVGVGDSMTLFETGVIEFLRMYLCAVPTLLPKKANFTISTEMVIGWRLCCMGLKR